VAQRVGRGVAVLFYDRSTRRGWVVSSTPRPHFTPGKDPVSIYRMLGGPQGRSGRAENLVPTGIRSRIVQSIVVAINRGIILKHNVGVMYMYSVQCMCLNM